jgi:hypothetical protein
MAWLAWLRAAVSRRLAAFDAMVDGLDVYAPWSRVSDHEERERWRRDG